MDKSALNKSYLAAAAAAAGMTMAIFLYAYIAEMLRRGGFQPPLTPPASYAVKYALYIIGLSALPILRFIGRLDTKKPTPEETVKSLYLLAIQRAALSEFPAICGLILFILTGARSDLYLLLVFALGLELYNFPRLGAWEERIRGEFGLL